MSGATLSLKYFKELTNFHECMPKNVFEKIEKLSIFVQDYDIKSKLNENSEAFVAGLYTFGINLNAK